MKTTVPSTWIAGWKRLLYCIVGLICVGLGYIGAILPGIPTTPFLLAASYCFVRSSPRLHAWLHRTPYFGTILHDWEQHRAIRKSVKVSAICTMLVVVSCSLYFSSLSIIAKCGIAGCAFIGLCVILSLPTRKTNPQEDLPSNRSRE